jgi:hypothetical protein
MEIFELLACDQVRRPLLNKLIQYHSSYRFDEVINNHHINEPNRTKPFQAQ